MRPFLVKEEKILLLAVKSDDVEEYVRATKQIIRNCIIDEDVDVEKFQIYDIEYLLLQLRINSVGEFLTLKFHPRKNTDCVECSKEREVKISLKDAKVEAEENHSNKIQLSDNLGIIMRAPSIKILTQIEKARIENNIDILFSVIWSCIESFYTSDELYSTADENVEKGIEFLESLLPDQFAKIENFFKTMPTVRQHVLVKCSTCDFQFTHTLSGISDFFD